MQSNISSAPAGRAGRRDAGRPGPASAVAVLAVLALWGAAASARQAGDRDTAETPRQAAQREVATAEAASRQAAQLRRHPDFREAVARDGEIEPMLERAERVLRAAKSGLTRAEQTRSATGFSDSGLLARRAAESFGQVEGRLRELFARLEAERRPPPPPPPPPPPSPPSPPPPPPPPSAAEIVPPPAASPPPSSSRRPRRPPAKLRQAAGAYLSGDYEAVVTGLAEIQFRQRKTRAHALLLRAAARYAQFLLGGETDYALRGQAAEDVTACKAAAPDLEPAEELFSPRFRDFFAAAR